VVVTEVVAETEGATITSTMTKVKRQIAIVIEDAIEVDMDVVMEAEESDAITVRHYASDYRRKLAEQVGQSNFAEASTQDDPTLLLA
jgi:hypothetical protein